MQDLLNGCAALAAITTIIITLLLAGGIPAYFIARRIETHPWDGIAFCLITVTPVFLAGAALVGYAIRVGTR